MLKFDATDNKNCLNNVTWLMLNMIYFFLFCVLQKTNSMGGWVNTERIVLF